MHSFIHCDLAGISVLHACERTVILHCVSDTRACVRVRVRVCVFARVNPYVYA